MLSSSFDSIYKTTIVTTTLTIEFLFVYSKISTFFIFFFSNCKHQSRRSCCLLAADEIVVNSRRKRFPQQAHLHVGMSVAAFPTLSLSLFPSLENIVLCISRYLIDTLTISANYHTAFEVQQIMRRHYNEPG